MPAAGISGLVRVGMELRRDEGCGAGEAMPAMAQMEPGGWGKEACGGCDHRANSDEDERTTARRRDTGRCRSARVD